ncbi:MAG: hypothetical protein AB8H86_12245 [Polyangiales bacterium]
MKRKGGLTLLVATLAGSLVACSDGFSIDEQDANVDAGDDARVMDAAARDVSASDAPASDMDAADLDAGPDNRCPAPWLATLVRDGDAVDLWRLSLAPDGSVSRCSPTQPFSLPSSAWDAELVDDTTAIVAGADGVTIVDIVSGVTLNSFPAPPGDFTQAQTFAFGSTSRLGAVAWGTGEESLDRYMYVGGYPSDGEAITLEMPDVGFCRAPVRVSSYLGDLAATSFIGCEPVFAFNPVTGDRIEDENLPQSTLGERFHVLPDATYAGTDTVTVILRFGGERRAVSNPCAGREFDAAPDPSNPMAAFVRCDNRLMRYDFDEEELSTIIGGTVAERDLEVLSLGVAVEL